MRFQEDQAEMVKRDRKRKGDDGKHLSSSCIKLLGDCFFNNVINIVDLLLRKMHNFRGLTDPLSLVLECRVGCHSSTFPFYLGGH